MNREFIIGFYMAMLMVITLALDGCANPYGNVNIDTTNKALIVAIAETRAANLLLQEVIKARVIDQGQAQSVLDTLRTTLQTLQAAKDSVAVSGDPTQGLDALDTAARSLDFVLGILAPLVAQLPAGPTASVPVTTLIFAYEEAA